MKKLIYSFVLGLSSFISSADIDIYSEDTLVFDNFYCIREMLCIRGDVFFLHNNVTDECFIAYSSKDLDESLRCIARPIEEVLIVCRNYNSNRVQTAAILYDGGDLFEVVYTKTKQEAELIFKRYLDQYYSSSFLTENYEGIETGFGVDQFMVSDNVKNCTILSKQYTDNRVNLAVSNFQGSEYEFDIEVMRLASLGGTHTIHYKGNRVTIESMLYNDSKDGSNFYFRGCLKDYDVFENGLFIKVNFDRE